MFQTHLKPWNPPDFGAFSCYHAKITPKTKREKSYLPNYQANRIFSRTPEANRRNETARNYPRGNVIRLIPAHKLKYNNLRS